MAPEIVVEPDWLYEFVASAEGEPVSFDEEPPEDDPE